MATEETQQSFTFEASKKASKKVSKTLRLLTVDEIFEQADEAMLRELAEDRRFEVKSNSIRPQALGEYFSMWANTMPHGGLILVGIRNDTVFEGCDSLSHKQLNNLEKTPTDNCPDAVYLSKRIEIKRDSDGISDFIVLFKVAYHKTRTIKTSNGNVFIRVGDTKKKLNANEIIALQEEKGEIQFESEHVRRLSYPSDFDKSLMRVFCETARTRKGWSDEHSIEAILELMHLGELRGNSEFTPTVACALLFANDPRSEIPGCRIRFLRFEGEKEGAGDEWNAVKDDFIDGTVPEQISKIEEVLSSQLRTFSKLDKHNRFSTTEEYPATAWHEAIVNACVHRSYGNGHGNRNIFVKMFDDRLEIESPGPFPPMVTPANIYNSHSPRNPFLMDAMYYMEYVKCAHEGTRRIRETMLDSSLPEPEFEQDSANDLSVRVVLRNNIKQRKVWIDRDVSMLLADQIAKELTSEQKRCLNYVAEYEKIGVSDASRLVHCSWPKAKKILESLKALGILFHDVRPALGRDPKARYKLKSIDAAKANPPPKKGRPLKRLRPRWSR